MLEPGQTITARGGQEYRIEGKVGQGRTALVYAAVPTDPTAEIRRVAIKVRLRGLDRELERLFKEEPENLLKLQRDPQAAPYIPHFYSGGQTAVGDDFLVEDFVSAPAVDDLLAQLRVLPEEEVMLIGKQFTAVLAGLHGLGHTYTDMKLENIHWDKPQQRITVTDWNVIGIYDLTSAEGTAQFEANKRRDLLRFAGFLYQLATGEPIASSVGLTVAEQQQSTAFQTLAEHTQWLLAKALHPNAAQRFSSATEMGEELGRWQQPDDELAHIAATKIPEKANDSAKSDRKQQSADELALIAVAKGSEELTDLDSREYAYRLMRLVQRRSEEHGDLLSPLLEDLLDLATEGYAEIQQNRKTNADIVRRSFAGGAFDDATARAGEALKDDPNDLAIWRWKQALDLQRTLGSQFTPALRATLETIIGHLNNRRWTAAAQLLAADPDHPSPLHPDLATIATQPTIVNLTNDARAMLQYDHAQRLLTAGQLDAADTALQSALAAQEELPGKAQDQHYQEAARLITRDLTAQVDALRDRRDHSARVTQLLEQAAALAPQQYEGILKLVRAAHGRDSEGVVVRDWCLAHAKEALLAHSDSLNEVLFAHDLLALARATQAATREVADWERWARQLGWVLILRERQGAAAAYDELQTMRLDQPAAATDDEAKFWGNVAALNGQLRQAACAVLQHEMKAWQERATDAEAQALVVQTDTDALFAPLVAKAAQVRVTAEEYLADAQVVAPSANADESSAETSGASAVQELVTQLRTLVAELQEKQVRAYYAQVSAQLADLDGELVKAIHTSQAGATPEADSANTMPLDSTEATHEHRLRRLYATQAQLETTVAPILGRLRALGTAAATRMAYYQANAGETSEFIRLLLDQFQSSAALSHTRYADAEKSLAARESTIIEQQSILEAQRESVLDTERIHKAEAEADLAKAKSAWYKAQQSHEAAQRQYLIGDYRHSLESHAQAYKDALDGVELARNSGLLEQQMKAARAITQESGWDVIKYTLTLLSDLQSPSDFQGDERSLGSDAATATNSADSATISAHQTVLNTSDVAKMGKLILQQITILHTQAVNDAFLPEAERLWREHEQLETQRATLSNQPDQAAENLAKDQQKLEQLIQRGMQHHFTGYNTVDQFRDLLTGVAAHKEALAGQLQQQAGHTQTLDRVGLLLAGSYPDTSATKDGP